MSDRFHFHQQLFAKLQQQINAFIQLDQEHDKNSLDELSLQLQNVHTALENHSDYLYEGQVLLCRIIAHFPALTSTIERDLLWFFGGDCLHYLGDEEIDRFQGLEELHEASPEADYEILRAKAFALH